MFPTPPKLVKDHHKRKYCQHKNKQRHCKRESRDIESQSTCYSNPFWYTCTQSQLIELHGQTPDKIAVLELKWEEELSPMPIEIQLTIRSRLQSVYWFAGVLRK